MTRDDLVKFLTETYEPNAELVWQTICYEDVENGVEGATPQLWTKFVENQDYYAGLATEFSEQAFSEFFGFVEDGGN